MIETREAPAYDPEAMRSFLVEVFGPYLTPDVSNYAKGRLRVWVGTEPSLSPRGWARPGLQVHSDVVDAFAEIIGWEFDYWLVTYSGDRQAVGIQPHRDAGYADYEAYGLNCVGECTFSYWNDRKAFGYARSSGTASMNGAPTDIVRMVPGTVVRFNCKNPHAADPLPGRWGMNFWRAKR